MLRGACDHPQVVQTAGGEHDFIDEALPPVAKGVGDDVAAFDPGDGMFDRDPHAADELADDDAVEHVKIAAEVMAIGSPAVRRLGSPCP